MDIRAYNQRIESLKQKSDQLEEENYHDIDTITKRYVFYSVRAKWIFVRRTTRQCINNGRFELKMDGPRR